MTIVQCEVFLLKKIFWRLSVTVSEKEHFLPFLAHWYTKSMIFLIEHICFQKYFMKNQLKLIFPKKYKLWSQQISNIWTLLYRQLLIIFLFFILLIFLLYWECVLFFKYKYRHLHAIFRKPLSILLCSLNNGDGN